MSDRYDEQAVKWGCESGGCCCSMQVDDLAAALRTGAQEAQVRVLAEIRDVGQARPDGAGRRDAFVRVLELLERIEKEGPL